MKTTLTILLLLWSLGASSQDYPNRPVRLLVGYPAGGGMDAIARVVAAKLSESLGQPLVVENRPGASGGVAAEALAASPTDGYVVMLAESGTLALPAVNPKVTFDPVRQFAPVGGVCMLPMAFVVNTAFPAKDTRELIAVLKASPGKHPYASPGIGSLQHLAFELFKRQAGVNALHIPYKGASAMMPDIMSGQVPIGVISALAAMGPTRAGKIRTLAVTSPQRLPSAPDWPTMAETLPGLGEFLGGARRLLRPDGQILADSTDVRVRMDPELGLSGTLQRPDGRYMGELHFQLEFQGRKGPPFGQLYVDAGTLKRYADAAGWGCEIILPPDDHGHYLVRLTSSR